jgi:hypothetical protein
MLRTIKLARNASIHVIQCTGLETSLMNIDPDFEQCFNALHQACHTLDSAELYVLHQLVDDIRGQRNSALKVYTLFFYKSRLSFS